MQGKVLFVANITKHILRFHLPYLKWFQEKGYETHVAANGPEEVPYCDVKHYLPIERSPFALSNIKAYHKLKKIIEEHNYILVHGHTPMGGVLSRLSSINARRKGTRLLYTAHGFHFYKGAPLINWLFYYPVEKILSKYTDGIITINSEDYNLLFARNFRSQDKYKINGVGVNIDRFRPVDEKVRSEMRRALGYLDDQFILIYLAEFIHRKNHRFIIESVAELASMLPNVKILFAGRGVLMEEMRSYARELGNTTYIDFLGFRQDVDKLVAIADIGISSSRQEGLGINLAEEMSAGLPIVASQDRGHRELVKHGINGFLFEQNNKEEFVHFISVLARDKNLRNEFGLQSMELVKKFSLEMAVEDMAKIYLNYIN